MIVGVTGNPRYEGLSQLLEHLRDAACKRDLTYQTEADLAHLWPNPVAPLDLAGGPPDVIICFGGDGTMLRTVRLVADHEIPILGVKIGRVGFLASATPEALDDALAALQAGDFLLERRRTLEAVIVDDDGNAGDVTTALNDVVVHKAGVARLIRLRVFQDEEEIGAFSSDGLIVATPTGSTAYSLSAGGPIVVPGVDALLVTPICPHTLAVRPIVVAGNARITIEVLPPWGEEEVFVSHDGQVGQALRKGHRVVITRSAFEARLVRLETEGFFALMRRKLQWGDITDRE